jgi:inactive STAND
MVKDLNLNLWQDFLKARSVDMKLSKAEQMLFLEYFGTPDEAEFAKTRRHTIANKVFPDSSNPENLCASHLTKIYSKFGLGKDKANQDANDSNRKALTLFLLLRGQYQSRLQATKIQEDKDAPEQLNEFLMHLNYYLEEAKFYSEMATLDRTGIFFAEIDGNHTQPWMLNRLVLKSPVLRSAHRKYVRVGPLWKSDENAVWQWIAGNNFDRSDTQSVLEKLSHECQEKTILLAMCGMESLRGSDLESILSNFWLPLQAILNDTLRDSRHKCLLLLVGHSGWLQSSKSCFEIQNEEQVCFKSTHLNGLYSKVLPRWSALTSHALKHWLEGEGVTAFCEQQSERSYEDFCQLLEIDVTRGNESIGSAHDIINTICAHVLKSPNGIAELEQSWKIAS